MEWLFDPWLRNLFLLVHISAGLFWMGWIVFLFFLLMPVLRRRLSDRAKDVLSALKSRVRKAVAGIILLVIATGLYNMAYRNFFDPEVLFGTTIGWLFQVKLGAGGLLFLIYLTAPYLTSLGSSNPLDSLDCEQSTGPAWVGIVLHVIAFSSGMTAAYIGLSIGG